MFTTSNLKKQKKKRKELSFMNSHAFLGDIISDIKNQKVSLNPLIGHTNITLTHMLNCHLSKIN